MSRMTYGKLKKRLARLTPRQLKYPVAVIGDEKGFYIEALHIQREDFLCPRGEPELAEPRSYWESHPEENKGQGRPQIVSRKGEPSLMIYDPPHR